MLPLIQRLMSAAERGFHKSLATLRKLQKDRGFVPHSSENASANGFVPQTEAPEIPGAPENLPETQQPFKQAAVPSDRLPENAEIRRRYAADLAAVLKLNAS
jgi:hypothetical protein